MLLNAPLSRLPTSKSILASIAFALGACTGSTSLPNTASPVAAVPAPAESRLFNDAYLTDDVGERFPERCFFAQNGPLRFSLDGAPIGDGDHPLPLTHPFEAIVIDEQANTVRVVLQDRSKHLRIVVFAPRDALHLVSTRAAWLAPSAELAPDPTAGVRIASGLLLNDKGRKGNVRLVSGKTERIHFEGWIAEETTGTVYVAEPFVYLQGDGVVADRAVITSPMGTILVRLPDPFDESSAQPSFTYEVESLSGAPPGFQAIHLRRKAIEIMGLVPVASFRKKPADWRASFSTSADLTRGILFPTLPHAMLRSGSALFSPKGERVGVTRSDKGVFLMNGGSVRDDGLVEVSILFEPFGFIRAWVRAEDLRPE